MYCIVLNCIVLYFIVLCCIVLYCIVLYYIPLQNIVVVLNTPCTILSLFLLYLTKSAVIENSGGSRPEAAGLEGSFTCIGNKLKSGRCRFQACYARGDRNPRYAPI